MTILFFLKVLENHEEFDSEVLRELRQWGQRDVPTVGHEEQIKDHFDRTARSGRD